MNPEYVGLSKVQLDFNNHARLAVSSFADPDPDPAVVGANRCVVY